MYFLTADVTKVFTYRQQISSIGYDADQHAVDFRWNLKLKREIHYVLQYLTKEERKYCLKKY